jgi:chemotaxis protein methyltransferase CheR
MNAIPRYLSAAELTRLCDYLYRRTGMLFGESKRYYIDRRVSERVLATASSSFSAYFSYLVSEPAEAELLINSFTVNETYFYREAHQLECLSTSILPDLIRHKVPGDRIRIWSVPCSTGEEPFSIAIWLLENWRLVDAYNVEIIGSDIDTAALRQAMVGRFGQRALSRLPEPLRDAYFHRIDEESWQIIDDLRQSVSFHQSNLIDTTSMAREGRFDVVFCRNVLIYFDDAARALAVNHLYDAMQPGAYICLGHTESMGRISQRFRPVRFGDTVVYQRAGEV